VLYRGTRRPEVAADQRTRFVALLRTSPVIFRLARKAGQRDREDDTADDDGSTARAGGGTADGAKADGPKGDDRATAGDTPKAGDTSKRR